MEEEEQQGLQVLLFSYHGKHYSAFSIAVHILFGVVCFCYANPYYMWHAAPGRWAQFPQSTTVSMSVVFLTLQQKQRVTDHTSASMALWMTLPSA